MHTEEVAPPNQDVLQVRLDANVTLIIMRDREERECVLVYLERRGAVTYRTEVRIPESQHERVGRFISLPFYAARSRVTDDVPVAAPDDEVTKPEGKPEKD